MKKITIITALFAVFQSNAQTIVSTTSQNKKVVLEEFTGVNCVYCPQGHAIANAVKNANPGNVFLINIHAGSFSTPSAGQPDFRTTFGSSIVGQSGVTGFPAATVNRTAFAGFSQNGTTGTAMNRSNWTNATNQTLAQSSYVNVATSATINAATRQLSVLVEAFYTGASPIATNKLNVALLQNNTVGPQTGGNMGSSYNHEHRLVHMLTGQWGEDITTTSAGTFVSRTYTYTIPANYNSVSAEMGNFEIVAFVAEGQQKIISANGTIPVYSGLVANDVKVKEVNSIDAQCASSVIPKIQIQNYGQNILTNLPITYSINGEAPQVYNWSGNLVSFAKEVVTLPLLNYTLLANNTLNVSLPADSNVADNIGSTTFSKAIVSTVSNISIKIILDQYGSETSWQLLNSANDIVASSPSYPDAAASGAYPQPDIDLVLPNECYRFVIKDAYGDGMSSGTGVGSYAVHSNGVLMSGINGSVFSSSETKVFEVSNLLSNENFDRKIVSVYPNPSSGILFLETEIATHVIIIDVTGKEVFKANNVFSHMPLNLSNLQKGLYFVKMKNEIGEQVEKVVIK